MPECYDNPQGLLAIMSALDSERLVQQVALPEGQQGQVCVCACVHLCLCMHVCVRMSVLGSLSSRCSSLPGLRGSRARCVCVLVGLVMAYLVASMHGTDVCCTRVLFAWSHAWGYALYDVPTLGHILTDKLHTKLGP